MEKVQKPKRMYRKKCRGGQPNCKNYVGDYKDVESFGCCEECDKYIDNNPYDPYWEHMNNDFENSKQYEELEKNGLHHDPDAYQDAYERYVQYYESWPAMRRRLVKEKQKSFK
jgi:hypothetical protein